MQASAKQQVIEKQSIASFIEQTRSDIREGEVDTLRCMIHAAPHDADLSDTIRALVTVPEGTLPACYDTVAGFNVWWRGPDILLDTAALDGDINTYFKGEEELVLERSRQLEVPTYTVPAAPALRARGVETQLAFHRGVLSAV